LEVKQLFEKVKINGKKYEEEWNNLFKEYEKKYPDDAKLFKNVMKGEYGEEWKSKLLYSKMKGKRLLQELVQEKC
jgi:transketolase